MTLSKSHVNIKSLAAAKCFMKTSIFLCVVKRAETCEIGLEIWFRPFRESFYER